MSQRMQERRGQYFGKSMNNVQARHVCRPGKAISKKDFEFLKVLGEGNFGRVFLVRKIGGVDNGKLYALKQLKKVNILQKQKRVEHSRTERRILEAVRKCPFLASLHYAFQTDSTLNLVLDYINGGDMHTHICRKQQFTEAELRVYLGEMILALETLHTSGIIYRDLKPENVMLDSDGHIVLTDFGLCKQFNVSDVIHRAYSYCGTPDYMAPEMGCDMGYDFTVDWWALGVTAHEMLTGRYPFPRPGEPNYPNNISPDMNNLLHGLLTRDPAHRLGSWGVQHIKQHPFFKSLNWEDLKNKKVPVPFVPKIDHDLDLSNFSEEFTKIAVNEPSVIVPRNPGKVHFRNYAYVAPSLILTNNLTEVKAKRCRRRKKSRAVGSERPDSKNYNDLSQLEGMHLPATTTTIKFGDVHCRDSLLLTSFSPLGTQQDSQLTNMGVSTASDEELPLIVEDNANRQSNNLLPSSVTRGLKRKGTLLENFEDKLVRKV